MSKIVDLAGREVTPRGDRPSDYASLSIRYERDDAGQFAVRLAATDHDGDEFKLVPSAALRQRLVVDICDLLAQVARFPVADELPTPEDAIGG